ncbi:MAG: DUF2461 domain-containing protein [Acidobacteria bacterium]|nr:DUF2461 domain-containing protein [Acidobacteriota bacterium]
MAKDLRFTPQLFDFLRELKANNRKEWFDANKDRYLNDARDPMLAFIAALRPRLNAISPFIIADPKPVGGSMLRIYRDIRFSKSKEPYKTMVSAFFYHQTGKENVPGLYLHLDPEHSFLALGIYQPDTATRRKITDAIAAKPEAWGKAISSPGFRKLCKLEGESLSKLPKQYDPDHPFADDLRRKDFIAVAYFSERQVCAKDFIERFDAVCQASNGLLEFLAKAVGVKW